MHKTRKFNDNILIGTKERQEENIVVGLEEVVPLEIYGRTWIQGPQNFQFGPYGQTRMEDHARGIDLATQNIQGKVLP